MTFGRLSRLLARNNISWTPATAGRLLFLLQGSFWSSIFAAAEDLRFGRRLETMHFGENPVFIIGHWRTGTTLLFKLMSLDEQFTAPTMFQAAEPDSMLTSREYYKPVMKIFMKGTRPMDNVKVGMDEPQEDEYALFRLTGRSPLERLVFPVNGSYFLEEWAAQKTTSKDQENDMVQLKKFFTKIQYLRNGIMLSKNPFHSFRIRSLRQAFPGARFIQIHRHPFSVVPSTMNLWDILLKENTLNNTIHKHTVQEICRGMDLLREKITEGTAELPPGSYAEIRFEEMEKDAVNSIRGLYSALGLKFPENMKGKIEKYMAENRNFQKNRFMLSEEEKTVIRSQLNDYMRKYKYS